MPKFFFYIMNGEAVIDTVGTEFPTLTAAKREAVRAAGAMIEQNGINWTGRSWRMFVADDVGKLVYSLEFTVDDHGSAAA